MAGVYEGAERWWTKAEFREANQKAKVQPTLNTKRAAEMHTFSNHARRVQQYIH